MICASICTIGDEILIGQIVDTNSAYIAAALNHGGVQVVGKFSVGDQKSAIVEAINYAFKQADILILTGGLGPTKDDITRQTLAEYTGSRQYVRSKAQEAHIIDLCKHRSPSFFELNQAQADVPDTCSVLPNPIGTAPGMWFELEYGSAKTKKVMISLPGVPFEMQRLFPMVMEKIAKTFPLGSIIHQSISTIGVPESALAAQIADWEAALPKELHLAYLPHPLTGVRLRLSQYGGDTQVGIRQIDAAFAAVKRILGTAVYGSGEDTLESVIGQLLVEKNATVATAESCTGGTIASLLTSVPGASRYFTGSVVAYHNRVKEELLQVSPELIVQHGAVSRECVEAMAVGARELFHTDYALATSGIVGPDGGSPEKPVGTLWLAVAGPSKVLSKTFISTGDRPRITDRFTASALNEFRLFLIS